MLRRFLLLAAVVVALVSAVASAQSIRRGVRLQITQIDGGGGWSGMAFVSVPPSRLTTTTGACGVAITGEGRASSGRIRSVRLALRGAEGEHASLPIGTGCPGASLTIGLDDGAELVAESGTVETSLSATGEAHGTFTASVMRDGIPLAISGEITFAPRTP